MKTNKMLGKLQEVIKAKAADLGLTLKTEIAEDGRLYVGHFVRAAQQANNFLFERLDIEGVSDVTPVVIDERQLDAMALNVIHNEFCMCLDREMRKTAVYKELHAKMTMVVLDESRATACDVTPGELHNKLSGLLGEN